MPRSFLFVLVLVSFATGSFPQMNAELPKAKFVSIEGHRGARGYLPENTIPSFTLALEQGADTLELDVVVTKDKKVLVSHEPWFSHLISTAPNGERIEKEKEREHNIYKMTYAETTKYDVGSIGNVGFPDQKPMKVSKPLMTDLFKAVEKFVNDKKLAPVRYNIEIKSAPQGDGTFHPAPDEFARLVLADIKKFGLEKRVIIQSFDLRPLKELKKMASTQQLALLVGPTEDPVLKLERLTFVPDTLSPHFSLVNEKLVAFCREKGMKLVTWTVNESADLERMSKFDLDGIITDYPDRAVQVFRKR
ncbi:MAG: glycerophosphodiester phosphodiesterase [Acidobacteria bacterium]|nr:glycerophosphodiester phosphodiesterase [Acidobacteriota bacterium]